MTSTDWKGLKDALIDRGFSVKTLGRDKMEYFAELPYMSVDIIRGGISHSGMLTDIDICTDLSADLIHEEARTASEVIDLIDVCISDYNEFAN
jgi:hypothetical protein